MKKDGPRRMGQIHQHLQDASFANKATGENWITAVYRDKKEKDQEDLENDPRYDTDSGGEGPPETSRQPLGEITNTHDEQQLVPKPPLELPSGIHY